MRNEIRLQASGSWARTARDASERSRASHQDTTELDLYSASGFRRLSPFRALAVLWHRSKERSDLTAALGHARADTEVPRLTL